MFIDVRQFVSAEEDFPPARCIACAGDVERPRDLEEVDRREAVHILQIEIARERLQRLVRLRGVLAQKGDADVVRTSLHRHSRAKPAIERLLRQREIRIRQLVVLRATDLGEKHALAVDADLELVRPLQPRHVADDVLQQDDVEFVDGVDGEVVPHQGAAARAERQAFDVILLRPIRRHAIHRANRRRPGIADGKGADLARSRQILLEERGRYFQHVRDVVEPVRFVVRGKKRRGVDVECQHVVDGRGVLGSVQAMKWRAAGVRLRERGAINRAFRETTRTHRSSFRRAWAFPVGASCRRAASE